MYQISVLFWLTLVTVTDFLVHSHMQTCFKLRCSTQHYLRQGQFSQHTATDRHGQNNTTSKLTTSYPHGSARF